MYYLRGLLGERINVRYFLSIGMIVSAFFAFLFGLAFWTNIHSLNFFIIVQVDVYFFYLYIYANIY